MAESARTEPKHKGTKEVSEEALRKHERLTLVLLLEGAVAIVAGMVLISQFLSEGKADRQVLLVNGVLFGLLVIGFAIVYLIRRAGDKKAAPKDSADKPDKAETA